MADNVRSSSAGSTNGILFATDELVISGSTDIVHVPLTKLGFGVGDTFTYASTNAPFPVFIHGSTPITANVTNTVSVSGSTVSVSGSSVSITGVVTVNSTGGVYSVSGSTVSVSGSTVSVSGSTVSVSGSSVSLNGITSDPGAGLPVRVMSSTTITVNVTNTVSVSGSTVSVSGSTVQLGTGTNNIGTVSGSTVSVSGSTVSITGVVTVNSTGGVYSVSGSTVSVSGSTVSITGVVTVNSTGGVYSVSGSTVSVSGSTVSVSGSTVSVVNGSTFLVQPQAYASGGADAFSFLTTTAAISTGSPIKASAGQVYTVHMFNTSTNPVFARLYNQTTTPASTDDANIKWRGIVPGAQGGAAGFIATWPLGLAFGTGIGIRLSAAVADTDTTVLTSSPTYGNVGYK